MEFQNSMFNDPIFRGDDLSFSWVSNEQPGVESTGVGSLIARLQPEEIKQVIVTIINIFKYDRDGKQLVTSKGKPYLNAKLYAVDKEGYEESFYANFFGFKMAEIGAAIGMPLAKSGNVPNINFLASKQAVVEVKKVSYIDRNGNSKDKLDIVKWIPWAGASSVITAAPMMDSDIPF